MPKKHFYIKNIKEIIKKKANELKLKPALKINQFIIKNKRFYSTLCLIQEKKKVFFKILIVDEIAPKEAIKREIKIRKFLSEFKEKINYPLLMCYENKKLPYWFISQYLEGKLLGNFYDLYLNDKKYIPGLVDTLFSLHQIPQNLMGKIAKEKDFYLWKRDFNQYLELVKEYRLGIGKKIVKEIDFKSIYNLFQEKKEFFDKSPLVLAHGDFTLANFVAPNEKLAITDWEQAHLDNFAYDLAHLWIQLWRYPDWQKGLISEFLSRLPKEKKIEFKNIFRIIIITEALGELHWSINICPKKYKIPAAKAALKTINASLKGFNYLSR